MSNLNENLRIVSVREMMAERLAIPNYQRPYRWGTQSALRLITDTYEAFKNRIPEYRMGQAMALITNAVGSCGSATGAKQLAFISI